MQHVSRAQHGYESFFYVYLVIYNETMLFKCLALRLPHSRYAIRFCLPFPFSWYMLLLIYVLIFIKKKKTHLDDPKCFPGKVQKLWTGTEEAGCGSFLRDSERWHGWKRRFSQTLHLASPTPSYPSVNSPNHLLEEQKGSVLVCVCVCVCFRWLMIITIVSRRTENWNWTSRDIFFLTSIFMACLDHKVTKAAHRWQPQRRCQARVSEGEPG